MSFLPISVFLTAWEKSQRNWPFCLMTKYPFRTIKYFVPGEIIDNEWRNYPFKCCDWRHISFIQQMFIPDHSRSMQWRCSNKEDTEILFFKDSSVCQGKQVLNELIMHFFSHYFITVVKKGTGCQRVHIRGPKLISWGQKKASLVNCCLS